MDGSDELAASVGERSGGVRAAGRFSRADDAGTAEFETQEGARAGSGRTGRLERQVREVPDHSGSFRGIQMNAQVWIAILVGLAAMIDDLARRQIANWIPLAALAAGFGWQIGQSGLTRIVVRGDRDGGRFRGLPDFLPAGRNGRGRREADGGLRRAAGVPSVDRSGVVDRGRGRLDRRGSFGRARLAACAGWTSTATQEQGQDSIPYAPAIALGVWLSLVPRV